MVNSSRQSIRRYVSIGLAATLVLVGGVGGWAATTEISGAVIAAGVLVVDSHVKDVQHATGGIVGEIAVRDGDHVAEGGLLLRLDRTIPAANLAVVTKALDQLSARKARLDAERRGDGDIVFSDALTQRRADPAVAEIMAGEAQFFATRRSARDGKKAQLQERITQLEKEAAGDSAQAEAKAKEIALVDVELGSMRDMWKKHLTTLDRLTALEREATRLDGERGQLIAAQAQTAGKIAETRLAIIQIDLDLSTEVNKDLRDLESKVGELMERKTAAEDALRRIDIRSPQTGIVQQSIAHTVGGVIAPGQVIMQIVPEDDRLVVEAKVSPIDIDQIRVGQPAALRFSAFNQRTTPEIDGSISRISPDSTTDERTGLSYYTVRIATTGSELARLGDVKLVAGMPVDSFIKTADRSVISYMVKPLKDQIDRAFRE